MKEYAHGDEFKDCQMSVQIHTPAKYEQINSRIC
jgi:hypothetical protein